MQEKSCRGIPSKDLNPRKTPPFKEAPKQLNRAWTLFFVIVEPENDAKALCGSSGRGGKGDVDFRMYGAMIRTGLIGMNPRPFQPGG